MRSVKRLESARLLRKRNNGIEIVAWWEVDLLHIGSSEPIIVIFFFCDLGGLLLFLFVVVVDTVVQLSVVVEHVLSVHLLALVSELKDVSWHDQRCDAFVLHVVVGDVATSRVKGRKDHALG